MPTEKRGGKRKKSVMSMVDEIRVFDNGGETFDNYTVVVFWKNLEPEEADVLYFGDKDLGAYSGTLGGSNAKWYDQVVTGHGGDLVGQPLKWGQVPADVRHNIEERIEGFEGTMFDKGHE